MRRGLIPTMMAITLVLGCSEEDGTGDGGAGMDGGTTRRDGSAPGDGSTPGSDGSASDGGVVVLPDGRVVGPTGTAPCQGHIYACGNTLDDDGDGLADSLDPDCLGPCSNNEAGFFLNIPGGDSAPCSLDCYFDQDQGSGNDECAWDHRCDMLEPDPNPLCAYREPPPASANCPDEQDPDCESFCGPLVPNGCDCFGCCNLPAGTDRWVFIGSVDGSGTPTCTLDDVEDDEACHPCTPVENCLNGCGRCELCLGRTFDDLPDDCFSTPAAGTLPDGGSVPPPDGGVIIDVCDDPTRQDCGAPGLPACPDGSFCLTGCCTFFG